MNRFQSPLNAARRLRRWTEGLIVLLFTALVLWSGALPASADDSNPYGFEKKAEKPDGTPWTGPVNEGDIIRYVLSYKPGTVNSGPVSIVDTLSPSLSYVAPTTAGAGWTWSTTPYSVGNQETYSNPGFGPETGFVDITIAAPAPPTNGQGDGTIPVPVLSLNKVFGVYHHVPKAASSSVDCWDLASLAKCPGYPKSSTTGSYILFTPITPQSVVRGTKVYFPGLRGPASANDETSLGIPTIGCFDGASDSACPDTMLDPNLTARIKDMGGLVEDPSTGRVFAAVNEKVFCRELSGSNWNNCAGGWNANGTVGVVPTPATAYSTNVVYLEVEQATPPSRVYIHHGSGVVQCLQISSGSVCGGWPAAGVNVSGGAAGETLSSVPDNAGTGEQGVCLWGQQHQPRGCVSNTAGPLAQFTIPGSANSLSSFRIPNTPKVFFPQWTAKPICVDYTGSTGVSCPGFTQGPPAGALDYGFALDPLDPQHCMLGLGHSNLIYRFDIITGEIGCQQQNAVRTPPIETLYCDGAPDPAKFQWSQIDVLTLSAAGTLTITKGSSTATVNIVSGTTSYVMPPAIGPGYDQVSFTFVPASGAPSSINLRIGYTSDKNPEICYQAKASCGDISNTATFTGSYNGVPFSISRKVSLGMATGPDCPPPPKDTCLKAKADVECGKIPGTYTVTLHVNGSGSMAPDKVQITPLTTGITILPAKPFYKVTNGKVKITVAGANPGDVIKLQVNGVAKREGSVEGSDLCCNGVVSITIPEGLDCQPEEPKVTVLKTCDPAVVVDGPILSYEAKCRISVTATGPVTGTFSLTDLLGPSGSSGTTNSISSAEPWICTPAPPPAVAAGTPIACSMSGADLNAAGGTSNIDVTIGFKSLDDIANAKQCANLAKDGKAVDESCTPITAPKQKPTLTVRKTCDPAVATPAVKGAEAKCHITVTATGSPLPASVQISDVLNAAGAGNQIVAMTSTENWACDPLPVSSSTPAQCSLPGTDLAAAGGQSVIDVTVRIVDSPAGKTPQQCVSAEGLDSGGKPELTAPQVCVPIKMVTTTPPPAPKCDAATTKLSGGQCRCIVKGMVPVTKTICGCPDGTKLSKGRCQAPPPPPPPPPKCDTDTTVLSKGLCACRYRNMTQSGALSCQCKKGYDFVPGRGCVAPKPRCTDGTRFNQNRNRCEPICGPDRTYDRKGNICIRIKTPPKCDMTTAVPRGDACACLYPGMTSDGTSCSCPKGEKFQRGRGCVSVEVQCKDGAQFNPRRQRCEPVCGKGEQYDPRRNACGKAEAP